MQKSHYSGGTHRRNRGAAPHNRRPQKKSGASINPHRFINKAVSVEQELPYQPQHTFHNFGLNSRTVATLDHLKFTEPSQIQDQCIPEVMTGHDVIGLANTGTGKTAAFLLPIINQLSIEPDLVSVLILAPTRELAQQIDQEFRRFSAGQKQFSALLVGGMNIGRQIQDIKRGPHLVIGTPGRIKDLISRRILRLQNVKTFVLDEADRMCDMGFVNDIRAIESELNRERQTLCFSATMTNSVKSIVEEFMKNPVTVSVVKNETNDHIDQDVIPARDKAHKIEILEEMLRTEDFSKVIIFGETKYGVQRLADRLSKSDLAAVAIHGNKTQGQRDRALRQFKSGEVNIMVATDVAARGLDIPHVSHVINFDIPKQYEDYVHRIGRTGRAGQSGKALTFIQDRS